MNFSSQNSCNRYKLLFSMDSFDFFQFFFSFSLDFHIFLMFAMSKMLSYQIVPNNLEQKRM